MAFTVGWPGGSSPVSVTDADSYFSDRGATAWAGTNAVKQGALTRATDYVKAMFLARFNTDLFVVNTGIVTIPDALSKAICEYAIIELVTPGSLAPPLKVDDSGNAVVMVAKKVGPIEKRYQVIGGGSRWMSRRRFPIPDALIAALLLPNYGASRVTR